MVVAPIVLGNRIINLLDAHADGITARPVTADATATYFTSMLISVPLALTQ